MAILWTFARGVEIQKLPSHKFTISGQILGLES